jgi:RNA polymerase sigma-70 factor (ECF subfamily)
MAIHADQIEDVYRRRYEAFASAIACVTRDRDSAIEVVQEAFARALARREQFRGDGPLEAWIWKIAIRTALERNGRSSSVPFEELTDPGFADPESDPELADAVRSLPPRQRLIVFLRYVGDLSYVDIAHACGISEGTVAATLAHARTALAEELGGGRRRAAGTQGTTLR